MRLQAAWAVPAGVMLTVAAVHPFMVRHMGLSPWHGGGFGMFADLDSPNRRAITVRVTAGGESREMPARSLGSVGRWLHEAKALPTPYRLQRVARAVADIPAVHAGRPEAVEVVVWSLDFDPRENAVSRRPFRTHRLDLGRRTGDAAAGAAR